jgi:hypothetical protein
LVLSRSPYKTDKKDLQKLLKIPAASLRRSASLCLSAGAITFPSKPAGADLLAIFFDLST